MIDEDKTKNVLAFDIETSGLDYRENQLLSLALVPINKKQKEKHGVLHLYHRPYRSRICWDDWARRNFDANIREAWERFAVNTTEVASRLLYYLDGFGAPVTLTGFNVGSFDVPFLKEMFRHLQCGYMYPNKKISHRFIDLHSVLYVAYTFGKLPKSACSSSGGFDAFGIEVPEGQRHTALGDAVATATLFRFLFDVDQSGMMYVKSSPPTT